MNNNNIESKYKIIGFIAFIIICIVLYFCIFGSNSKENNTSKEPDEIELMTYAQMVLEDNLYKERLITLTYFIQDKKKDGGKYVSSDVHIKRIDKVEFKIITKENITIDVDNIMNISSRDITFNFDYESDDVI